ncbi:class I SAM-dependent methyltransferase [Pseudomonas antarctica]|uniref:class I SAM-dependent methyltransferase n=1 Tax=Pseudomonas antarctica TaxID=219572 RepID=UPI00387B3579
MDSRQTLITKHLDLSGCGLEIAPLFRPVVPKDRFNVYYTDYTSTEALREKNATNFTAHSGIYSGIQTLDFVWSPGSSLAESAPSGVVFDYALASHVIEHVPNMIGWLNEILSVLKVGGKLALVIPNKEACFDYYRQTTPVAEFVDAWIRKASKPSPKQIFDCLSLAVVDTDQPGTRSFDLHVPLVEAKRTYTLEQAMQYAINSYRSDEYLDVHCSAFSPESFVEVITTLVELGLLNVSMSDPDQGEPSVGSGGVSGEFMVTLIKLGEPKLSALPGIQATNDSIPPTPTPTPPLTLTLTLHSDLQHAREAFNDAVVIQDELKEQLRFAPSVKRVLRQLIGRA